MRQSGSQTCTGSFCLCPIVWLITCAECRHSEISLHPFPKDVPIPQFLQGVSKALSQSVSCHCWEQVAKHLFGQLCHQTNNTSRPRGTAVSPWFLTPSCARARISLPADTPSEQTASPADGGCVFMSVALLLSGLHLLLA